MTTLTAIQQMLIEEFGLPAAEIGPDALLEELGIDSMSTIEFLFELEKKFKLNMDGEPNAIKTVGDIAREVDLQIAKQHGTNPPAEAKSA